MVFSYINQAHIHAVSVQKSRTPLGMPPVGPKLKALRLSAKPSLSIRKIADELEIPHASYQFYEREGGYKKPYLPLDFTRRVASILAQYGVDPAEVMKLAGLEDAEAAPEAQKIESTQPPVQFISLPVMLPSEAALADMFETLLALIPADATRAEAARILAQRLPTGFAAIGPVLPVPGLVHALEAAEASLSPARDHPAP